MDKINKTKFKKMLENTRNGIPNTLEDFLNLSDEQHRKIQEAKREWRRKEYIKSKEEE